MSAAMAASAQTETSTTLESPFGRLLIAADGAAIIRLTWLNGGSAPAAQSDPAHPLLARAARQLAEYFGGARRVFDLPLAPAGGSLQQAVCRAMLEIPYGETRTYGDLAARLGVAAQPIGQACGGNPIAIIIPCHRVLAAGGKTGGFSGGAGVETKLALLRHEGALLL
jgi:methylated-DNA-[protein]-cysteine S-methyltransferase